MSYLRPLPLAAVLAAALAAATAAHAAPTVVGSPISIQHQMVTSDFGIAIDASPAAGTGATAEPAPRFSTGLQIDRVRTEGVSTSSFTVPLWYTIRSEVDPGRQLILSMPLNVSRTAGSRTYGVQPGAALRLPLGENWALYPALRYGRTDSSDTGIRGDVALASITSVYVWRLGAVDVSLANMLGYSKLVSMEFNDTGIDAEARNTVYRNGLMVSQPVTFMGRKSSVEYSYVNTRYTGTDLLTNHLNEVAVTLGTNKRAEPVRSFYRAGLSYLWSSRDHGVGVKLQYWF